MPVFIMIHRQKRGSRGLAATNDPSCSSPSPVNATVSPHTGMEGMAELFQYRISNLLLEQAQKFM